MNEVEQKALDLAEKNVKLILEARKEAYEKAIAAGYTADDYAFEDNLYEVIENPSIPYKVTLIKKGE